ncbi:MAG: LysR family transcriptional regulator, partial [Cyanobacteria bacterium P01_G01_bin.38]
MELRHLRYFVMVAETLHFGRAAERLQMTQPALSKQIAGLEKELNVQLFSRTRRTVQLTPAGQALLEGTNPMLLQIDEMIQRVKRTASGQEGALTIGFSDTAAATVLPTLVRRFRDRCPNVEIGMTELCTEAQVRALNER